VQAHPFDPALLPPTPPCTEPPASRAFITDPALWGDGSLDRALTSALRALSVRELCVPPPPPERRGSLSKQLHSEGGAEPLYASPLPAPLQQVLATHKVDPGGAQLWYALCRLSTAPQLDAQQAREQSRGGVGVGAASETIASKAEAWLTRQFSSEGTVVAHVFALAPVAREHGDAAELKLLNMLLALCEPVLANHGGAVLDRGRALTCLFTSVADASAAVRALRLTLSDHNDSVKAAREPAKQQQGFLDPARRASASALAGEGAGRRESNSSAAGSARSRRGSVATGGRARGGPESKASPGETLLTLDGSALHVSRMWLCPEAHAAVGEAREEAVALASQAAQVAPAAAEHTRVLLSQGAALVLAEPAYTAPPPASRPRDVAASPRGFAGAGSRIGTSQAAAATTEQVVARVNSSPCPTHAPARGAGPGVFPASPLQPAALSGPASQSSAPPRASLLGLSGEAATPAITTPRARSDSVGSEGSNAGAGARSLSLRPAAAVSSGARDGPAGGEGSASETPSLRRLSLAARASPSATSSGRVARPPLPVRSSDPADPSSSLAPAPCLLPQPSPQPAALTKSAGTSERDIAGSNARHALPADPKPARRGSLALAENAGGAEQATSSASASEPAARPPGAAAFAAHATPGKAAASGDPHRASPSTPLRRASLSSDLAPLVSGKSSAMGGGREASPMPLLTLGHENLEEIPGEARLSRLLAAWARPGPERLAALRKLLSLYHAEPPSPARNSPAAPTAAHNTGGALGAATLGPQFAPAVTRLVQLLRESWRGSADGKRGELEAEGDGWAEALREKQVLAELLKEMVLSDDDAFSTQAASLSADMLRAVLEVMARTTPTQQPELFRACVELNYVLFAVLAPSTVLALALESISDPNGSGDAGLKSPPSAAMCVWCLRAAVYAVGRLDAESLGELCQPLLRSLASALEHPAAQVRQTVFDCFGAVHAVLGDRMFAIAGGAGSPDPSQSPILTKYQLHLVKLRVQAKGAPATTTQAESTSGI
jgi:hypothetical protein